MWKVSWIQLMNNSCIWDDTKTFSFLFAKCLSGDVSILSKNGFTNGRYELFGESCMYSIKPWLFFGRCVSDASVDEDLIQRHFQMQRIHFPIDREDIAVVVPLVSYIWRRATTPLPIDQTIGKAISLGWTFRHVCNHVLVLLVKIMVSMYLNVLVVMIVVPVLLVDSVRCSASKGCYNSLWSDELVHLPRHGPFVPAATGMGV